VYRFAGCELDLGRRELRRAGEVVPLQPKVFDLLVYLATHRDRAVGKAEIQEAIWADVVVSEASLTQAIRKARRALGDEADQQGIIRTVHGHGYRFIAAFDGPAGGPQSASAPDEPQRAAPEAEPLAAPQRPPDPRPIVAVLPFQNMSDQEEQEYFSDAVAQDIITHLSRHRWLNVLARNATFGYKHRAVDLRRVAAELGAQYVVAGSVRRAGERIRVTVELVDARSGTQKWAERYDRDLADVFEVQDEITSMVAARLEPEIGFAERQRVIRSAHADLQAWDSYHLGIAHFFRFTAEDNAEAQRRLQRSRELDPGFGEAHAWWAYAVVLGMVYWETEPSPALLDAALAATQRALELDDQNAVFYALKARVQLARGEYDSARRANELAITMSPNDPQRWAFLTYGALALIFKRDFPAAVAWADRAREIPNCQYWTIAHKAVALAHLGRGAEARAVMAETVAACPRFSIPFARQKLFYLKSRDQLDIYLAGLERAGAPA
jgi:TolB-like protein